MINLDLLYISESDVAEFKELSTSPLKVSDLPNHETFSKVENIFKFITVFSVARKFQEIAAIINFYDWDIDVTENGSLEIVLSHLFHGIDFDFNQKM
jgi:hypothetical protein